MLLVTAYPLGYAFVLSLHNFRLTDPQGRGFVGLSNYLVILSDPIWWNDFVTTLAITVVTVAAELLLGFWFAFVMLRIIRGRGPLRTAILIPYGIVTVVSAFVWRYAFAVDSGFVNQWLNISGFDWFGDRWSAIFVICLSE
ncbi:MAG: sugar ABC transporter permease, partial [Mycobacterium sp.]